MSGPNRNLPAGFRCRVCGGDDTNHKAVLDETNAFRCGNCGFWFCDPIVSTDTESSGEKSVTTAEDYTSYMLRPPNPAGISRLARNRYAQYRRLLGKDRFRLLEIGCGTGELGAEFVKLGVDYTGINIDPRIVERAAANSGGGRILHADIFESRLDGEYDAVCLHQVLEHIGDPRVLAGRIAELSKADSILHGDVPNWWRLTSRIESVVRLNRKRYRAL